MNRTPQAVDSTPDNTCWIFVAGKAEPRHLYDIIFGVYALRVRGVPDQNIWVFADHPASQQHFGPYGIQNVLPVGELPVRLPSLPAFDLVVVVATGHGDRAGIPVEAGPSVNPTQLLKAVRACPGIKGGAIVLGQCFAGLFNYTNAGYDPSAVPLSLIGSTSLNLSLSLPITLPSPLGTRDGSSGLHQWVGNVFVIRFFEWLLNPQDVDGDGHHTLMDAFKHASVMANEDLRNQKGTNHIQVTALHADMQRIVQSLQAQTDPAAQGPLLLAFGAAQQQLKNVLDNLYVHQEPWVLHARFASKIQFSIAPPPAPPAPAPGSP